MFYHTYESTGVHTLQGPHSTCVSFFRKDITQTQNSATTEPISLLRDGFCSGRVATTAVVVAKKLVQN
jgi:hypothetical protein